MLCLFPPRLPAFAGLALLLSSLSACGVQIYGIYRVDLSAASSISMASMDIKGVSHVRLIDSGLLSTESNHDSALDSTHVLIPPMGSLAPMVRW